MCGRFVLALHGVELAEELTDLNPYPRLRLDELRPRYNVAPTDEIAVVRRAAERLELDRLRWGIYVRGRQLINVRGDTALRSGLFGALLDRHRVLIPATGFYEWMRHRQPMLVGPTEGRLLGLAGLEGHWRDPRTARSVPALVIVTTTPNGVMSRLHDRQPVVLPREAWRHWLDGDAGTSDVEELLQPCPDEWLTIRPASPAVNDVRNDGPELLLEPVGLPEELELPWR